MKKKIIINIYLALAISTLGFAQQVKHPNISEADVSRVLKTLSADDMRGRSALKPQEIGKAADFILLDTDLINGDIKNLLNTTVSQTFINGKTVYKKLPEK